MMDADGQHNPAYIPQFLEKLEEYDFVFGCRFYKEESAPTNKWASNLFASALYAEMTGQYFTDVSCGFKGLHIDEDLIAAVKNSQGFEIIYEGVVCIKEAVRDCRLILLYTTNGNWGIT